jgi:hypothetical protein
MDLRSQLLSKEVSLKISSLKMTKYFVKTLKILNFQLINTVKILETKS